jgi:hypothetical protein
VQVAQQQTFQAEISALKGKKKKKKNNFHIFKDCRFVIRQEARTQIILLYEQYHHQNS